MRLSADAHLCPHCGGAFSLKLEAVQQAPEPVDEPRQPPPEQFLEPAVIAYRMRISDSHVRRLCQRGQKLDIPGIEKRGGRWVATVDAIRAAMDMRV